MGQGAPEKRTGFIFHLYLPDQRLRTPHVKQIDPSAPNPSPSNNQTKTRTRAPDVPRAKVRQPPGTPASREAALLLFTPRQCELVEIIDQHLRDRNPSDARLVYIARAQAELRDSDVLRLTNCNWAELAAMLFKRHRSTLSRYQTFEFLTESQVQRTTLGRCGLERLCKENPLHLDLLLKHAQAGQHVGFLLQVHTLALLYPPARIEYVIAAVLSERPIPPLPDGTVPELPPEITLEERVDKGRTRLRRTVNALIDLVEPLEDPDGAEQAQALVMAVDADLLRLEGALSRLRHLPPPPEPPDPDRGPGDDADDAEDTDDDAASAIEEAPEVAAAPAAAAAPAPEAVAAAPEAAPPPLPTETPPDDDLVELDCPDELPPDQFPTGDHVSAAYVNARRLAKTPPPPFLPGGGRPAPAPASSPSTFVLAVPYPIDIPDPTPAEVLSGALIVSMTHIHSAAEKVVSLFDHPHYLKVHPALHHALWRASAEFFAAKQQLEPMFEEAAAGGEAQLLALRQDPCHPLSDYYPLAIPPPPGAAAMTHVVYHLVDPTGERAPNEAERQIRHLLGLYRHFDQAIYDWVRAFGTDPHVAPDLGYQLLRTLQEASSESINLKMEVFPQAQAYQQTLAITAVEAQQRRQLSEAHLTVLGEATLPPQYGLFGLMNGAPVGVSFTTAQVMLMLGSQGFGKSHMQALLRELLHLRLPGLNRLVKELRSITLLANWELGTGNMQFLRGLDPNPSAAARARLQQEFGIEYAGNVAFLRQRLICLPGMEQHYSAGLPDLTERGLEVIPGLLHETEIVEDMAMLMNLSEGSDRPAYQRFIDERIGQLGPDATPARLIREVQRSKLPLSSQGILIGRLAQLLRVTSKYERFGPLIEDNVPQFVLFESAYLPRELLLPLQIALVNAVVRLLRKMGLHLWVFLDEMVKYGYSPSMLRFLKRLAAEVRHRSVSLCCGGQTMHDLPAELLSLVTVAVLFRLASPAELRRWAESVPGYSGMRHPEVLALAMGEALIASVRSTTGRCTQRAERVQLRDALHDPVGESLAAAEDDAPALWG